MPENISILFQGTLKEVGQEYGENQWGEYSYSHRQVTILETAPQIRTIKVTYTYSDSPICFGIRTFHVAIPYFQFALANGRVVVAFKRSQGNPFGRMSLPCLPNIYNNGTVCFGRQKVHVEGTLKNTVEMLGQFWMTEFDLYPIYGWGGLVCLQSLWSLSADSHTPRIIRYFEAWEKVTKEQGKPDFMLSLDWPANLDWKDFMRKRATFR